MRTCIVVVLLFSLGAAALATPAHAEDRAALRRAVAAPTDAVTTERLVRHATPAWTELATSNSACAPQPTVCDPCCLPYPAPCGDPCTWHGAVTLTAWVPGIDGNMTVRGRRAEIDVTPMDVLEDFDKIETIFQGRVAVYRGKWGFSLAGLTVRFEDTLELEENGQPITGGIGMDMLEACAWYCLKRCPMEVGCNPRCPGFTAYEVYVGARYFSMQLELDRGAGAAAPALAVRRVKDWVDPIVGGKVTWVLGGGWAFDVQGDVGGFGIGSDFAWNLRAGVQYRPWRLASFELGFKVIDMDYAEGSGTDRFEFDAALWGPYLGVTFRF